MRLVGLHQYAPNSRKHTFGEAAIVLDERGPSQICFALTILQLIDRQTAARKRIEYPPTVPAWHILPILQEKSLNSKTV